MLPHLASRRACASSVIDMRSLRAVTNVSFNFHHGDSYNPEDMEKDKKEAIARFWRVIEKYSNEDKSLFVKFATGRTRLA